MLTMDSWWLAGWLVSNTLVATLIAALAWIADRKLRRPSLAHCLWAFVLLKLLTPPLVTLPIVLDPADFGWLISERATSGDIPLQSLSDSRDHRLLGSIGVAIGSPPEATSRSSQPFSSWALGVWFCGSILLSIWIASSSRRLHRLLRDRGRLDRLATEQAAQLVGSNAAPPVWLVDAVVSPMVIGAGRRSRIVFPARLWQRLDGESQQLLLQHELAHWRRGDPWVRYLEAIAWVLHWWHPLVWLARQQIEACEERCCDQHASSGRNGQQRVYAQAILSTLDFLAEPDVELRVIANRPVASTIGYVPQIERRLREIMTAPSRPGLGRPSRCLIAAVLLLLPLHPALVIHRESGADAHSVMQGNAPTNASTNASVQHRQ